MMKVGGKKKDEKSTTAVASMRGKWDMKRDVFLTYLSDNREAGQYKSHISTSRNEPRIGQTGLLSDFRLKDEC